MIAFFVENLKVFKKFSSCFENIHDSVFKLRRMSVSSKNHSCLMKLSKFFATLLFNAKIRVNQWQNLIQSVRFKRPYDHGTMGLFFWGSESEGSTKTFDQPWKNWELRIPNFQSDYPSFISSFSFWLPMLNAKASFRINKPRKIGKIGLRWDFAFFEFFQRFKKFFVHSVVHMNFFFYLLNETVPEVNRMSGQWISSKYLRFFCIFNKAKAYFSRFFFENQIVIDILKNRYKFGSAYAPSPRWFSIFSFFRTFTVSASKFMKKILAYLLKSRSNFQMSGENFMYRFLDVISDKNTSITISITSKICKFHDIDFTGKPNLNQRPQRLTGWGPKLGACYSLNSWETMRGWVEAPVPPQVNKHNLLNCGHKSNRKIIDAQMAFFGTGCIINEQVILQDQEGVLAWVSERLA